MHSVNRPMVCRENLNFLPVLKYFFFRQIDNANAKCDIIYNE